MSLYFIILITGQVAALGFTFEILLPYAIRRNLWPVNSCQTPRSYSQRMQPHFVVGYAVAALSFVHAMVSMSGGRMPATNMAGLTSASFCLLLILMQVTVGLTMRNPQAVGWRSLRRVHFWTMVACVPLLLAHLWLN